MQINTTMRYHLILLRMTIINKATKNKRLRWHEEKRILLHCCQEYKFMQSLWKTVWRLLYKLKIELLYDPTISLLCIHLEKMLIQKDTCTLIFRAALCTQLRQGHNLNVNRMDKEDVVHIYNGILLSHKDIMK